MPYERIRKGSVTYAQDPIVRMRRVRAAGVSKSEKCMLRLLSFAAYISQITSNAAIALWKLDFVDQNRGTWPRSGPPLSQEKGY